MPRTRPIAAVIPPWPEGVPGMPAATPTDRPISVLIRHGERPPLAPGDVGIALGLTPTGRRQAEALGGILSRRLGRLHASPLLRCKETADALAFGAGSPMTGTDDRLLGDPGVFVVDGARALEHWRTRGNDEVMEHLAYGDRIWEGLAEPVGAARRLAAHIAEPLRADGPPDVHVFVTHDAILLPVVARLLALGLDRNWCPHFLESAIFWREEAALCLAYRDLRGSIRPW